VALEALQHIDALNEGVLASAVGGWLHQPALPSQVCHRQSHYPLLFFGIIQSFLLCNGVSTFASFMPWFEYFVNHSG
jgi:hypothetical protein